jgi:uncharacterized protein YndB with AHSA1/START domain
METGPRSSRSSLTRAVIRASREAVYRAFLDPSALAAWMAPEGMTGRVHAFEGREGGGYWMSPFYSSDRGGSRGKTALGKLARLLEG